MHSNDRVSEVVSAHWRAVLGVADAGLDDDFFGLGGDSLQAITLVENVERDLDIQFPIEVLFIDGSLKAVVSACQAEVDTGR